MQGVFSAMAAKLLKFQPVRVVAAVLLGGVIAFFAVSTRQVNDLAHIFLGHDILFSTYPAKAPLP
jgi:hypothetical protein